MPRISVVVPVYNNQAQLARCLASIAAQTHQDLEVIVVDDGSTDESGQIAAAQAAADQRFTVLTTPNCGPGAARNRGVAAASAEFLAFADADDEVPPPAYATLLAALQRTGADFASGGVLRLTASGLTESGLHARAIKADRDRTHVTRTPELLYDVSVFNKLFRQSFWDASGLLFPEGMVWEDLVAMTEAHVAASAVTVITAPVYHWRDRDQGSPSITQSRTTIANFADRITALEMIDAFLGGRNLTGLLAKHQHKALVNDLWLYIRDLPATSGGYQERFSELSRRYLSGVRPAVITGLPATRKLAYHLIQRGLTAELGQYAAWLADRAQLAPPVLRRFGRLQADLPFRGDRALRIPAAVFRPRWRELDPFVEVDSISWRQNSLVIAGRAYVPSVEISERKHTTKIVLLWPEGRRGLPILTVARPVRVPGGGPAGAAPGGRGGDEWSGFVARIRCRRFRAAGRWRPGRWDCFIVVRGRGVWRPARLHTPASPAALDPAAVRVGPPGSGLELAPVWAGRRLRIELRRAQPVSDRARPASDPVAAGPRDATALDGDMPLVDEHGWDSAGRLVLRGRLPAARGADGWELVLRRSADGATHAMAISREPPAAAAAEPVPNTGQSAAGHRFEAAVTVAAMPLFGDPLPLRDGSWQVLFRRQPANGETPGPGAAAPAALIPPALGPGALAGGAGRIRIGRKQYRCAAIPANGPGSAAFGAGSAAAGAPPGPAPPALTVTAGPALGLAERGRIRRRLLRQVYYPVQRRLRARDDIVLVSYAGKQCGDNPGGIAGELRRRHDPRRQVWVVTDWSVPVPDGAAAVLLGSAGYYAAIGRSRYLIANDHMPQPFRKRSGQRYVQTWHGAPFKKIGHDIAEPRFASGERYFDFLDADAAQWDLLLSPSPYATPILRRSFRYRGAVCESGYPRNDVLHAAGAEEHAARVRRRLGIPPGSRVALYAPTWRDDQHDAAGRYRIDLALDVAAAASRLSGRFLLLVRGHHLTGGGPGRLPAGFAADVTSYPEMADLLLITDVLITDYSSAIFDFAPKGRPILFFSYDLESYRDRVRGFVFDFEAEAPGPLLASSDEVISALEDLDSVRERYRNALAAFAGRFCPLDDGKSAWRACDQIFTG